MRISPLPRLPWRRWLNPFALSATFAFVAPNAAATDVTVPLQLEHAFIESLLRAQVYNAPGGTLRPWDDESGCNYLVLSDPQVDTHQGKLRIRSTGEARVGTAFAGQCLLLAQWNGVLETLEDLTLEPGKPVLHVRVADSRLLSAQGQPEKASDLLWQRVKEHVHPQLETMTVDLAAPMADVKAMLPLFLPNRDTEAIQKILDTVAFTAVDANEQGVRAQLRIDVASAAAPPAPTAPEPQLSAEEAAAWQAYLDNWDAFFTYVMKHAAADFADAALQSELLEVLLDTRYALADALTKPAPAHFDPVRQIFLDTWNRLAPLLRRVAAGQTRVAIRLEYLGFITATDALQALDQLGPAVGVDVSMDGLRRLARIVAPDDTADPLQASDELDPELRRHFGFGDPLPAPEIDPDVDLLNWLFTPAWADAAPSPATLKRLNSWAPRATELDDYLPLVRDLLKNAGETALRASKLETAFHTVYRNLVLSTAWQESCWRQYIKRGGKVATLRSGSGSVGIMQVNPRVWRGFYDVKGLKGDISYNAKAGSEILMHYLFDYAIAKKEHEKTKSLDNLARASYSAYNAGPGKLTRYRDPKAVAREKRVDGDFWEKYQDIKKGDHLAVVKCFGG
jgi:hypothetical protein